MFGMATPVCPMAPAGAAFPQHERCGLDPDDAQHVTKDYRRILELREVDAVCIAAPDHWHAKMAIDAAAAGKHIYCEKPMTKTIDEAHAVVDAARRHNIVMKVGVQTMADPSVRSRQRYDATRRARPRLPGPD